MRASVYLFKVNRHLSCKTDSLRSRPVNKLFQYFLNLFFVILIHKLKKADKIHSEFFCPRSRALKAPAKRSQHFNTTNRNIVRRNMLVAFGHPVATCCDMLGVVGSNLKMVKVVWAASSNNVAPRHAH